MITTLVKYSGYAILGGGALVASTVMSGQEAKAVAENYALTPAQVSVMKFCTSDLNKTGLTYEASVSDIEACGCIASKIRVQSDFEVALTQGIDDYETHYGNLANTGQELAGQMLGQITVGNLPASVRRDIVRFGDAYEGAENACLSQF